jgi:hypothetical protein
MKKNLRKINSSILAACIVTVFMAVTTATTTPVNALQPVTLTLIGGSGTNLTRNETEMLSMPSTTGIGGTKGSGGNVNNVGTYQGVSLLYLCNLVGGIQNGSIIRTIDVTGTFSVDFNYTQVQNGVGFNTYNATGGAALNATQPLTVIVAYSYNGSDLSSSNGPLRMGILSPEGLVTDGSLWNKQVAKIQIIPPAVPEFAPDSALIVIACFVALTMFVAFKKGLNTPHMSRRIRG